MHPALPFPRPRIASWLLLSPWLLLAAPSSAQPEGGATPQEQPAGTGKPAAADTPATARKPTAAKTAATDAPDPPPTAEQARQAAAEKRKQLALGKYEQGVEAFGQKRYKDAIDLFLAADQIAKSAAFAFNAGLAFEQMGDHANALRWTREYLRRKPDATDRPATLERIAVYESKLADKGVQQLTVLSHPSGARLVVDAEPRGVTPWTGELGPGLHKALVQLPGYQDAQRTFKLSLEHAMDVELELVPASAETPGASNGQVPPHRHDTVGNALWPIAWITLGVGVGALGTGLGFELARASAAKDADSATAPAEVADRTEAMDDRRTAAQVLITTGVLLAAAGGVMLAVELARPTDEEPVAEVGIGCEGTLCGLVGVGRF